MKKQILSISKMKFFILTGTLLTAGLLFQNGYAAENAKPEREAPDAFRVLVWHGSNNRHGNEFDSALKALSWEHKKLKSNQKDMALFTDEGLAEYDMILGTPLLNFLKKDKDFLAEMDLTPYAGHLRTFVKNGGALVLTDVLYPASYTWLTALDPGLAFSIHTQCANERDPIDENPVSPFRYLPNTKRDHNSWGHLVLPEKHEWEIVLRCGQGAPIVLVKRIGKGFVYVTALRQPDKETLENIRANLELQRMGLRVKHFDMPEIKTGRGTISITVTNSTQKEIRLDAALAFTRVHTADAPLRFRKNAVLAPQQDAEIAVPYDNRFRGKVNVRFSLRADNDTAVIVNRTIQLPELLTVLAPRYRSLALESELKKHGLIQIGFSIAPYKEDTKHLTVKTGVETADGKSIGNSDERNVTELQTRFPLSVGALAPGEYTIVSRIFENDVLKETEKSKFRVLKDSECITFINDDMNLVVDGKPFFPVGLYHISPDDLKQYGKELGINTIQLFSWHSAGVETAEKLGIKVLWEQNHRQPGNIEKIISTNTVPRDGGRGPRLIDHPNIIVWYGRDEPYEADLESAAQLTDAFHRADLRRPTYMVSYMTRIFEASAKTADIFAPDPYPFPQRAITMVADWMDLAWKATKGDKPVICVPQCFGVETEGAFRAMAYLALTHEARGLIWYPWDDGKSDKNPRGGSGLKYNPELQTVFKDVVAQIKTLSPALLNKDGRKQFKSADEKIHGLYCQESPDKRYMLFVNPHDEENIIDLSKMDGLKDVSVLSNIFGTDMVKSSEPLKMKPYETKAFLLTK